MNDNRELVLRINDAEIATIDALNQIVQAYNLPIFLFEPIIDRIHKHLMDAKKEEIAAARQRESARQEAQTQNDDTPENNAQ